MPLVGMKLDIARNDSIVQVGMFGRIGVGVSFKYLRTNRILQKLNYKFTELI